jgi:hypothetical protein
MRNVMRRTWETPLAQALAYADRGWAVLRIYGIHQGRCMCGKDDCNAGKHPWTEHGFKDATTDPTTIQCWFLATPQANVGIATGAVSGLVVLDVDPRHGGEESLRRLEARYGPLPPTAEVASGGGGRHFYFQHPGPETVVRTRAKFDEFPGLDLKADGGCVVAPPSVHATGHRYRWVEEPEYLWPEP